MPDIRFEERRRAERLAPEELARHQVVRLNHLLDAILPHNKFYAEKLAGVRLPLASPEDVARLPYTFKDELIGEAPFDYAANLTYPLERYVRFHRTSGTRGRPLAVLDTAADWGWWMDVWQYVLDAAELGPEDRAAMLFSFGPFIGFWSANDALLARGCMTIPCGGLSTLARLELLRTSRATVVFCTPSYALHAAEVAAENQIEVASLEVRRIVVAGEPGGSIPAVRSRIEAAWNAKVIDHSGATEVGPWGYADAENRGLRVIESHFLAEFLSLETGRPAAEGELAELVLTTLGREGAPVIRYRTGDLVRPVWSAPGENRFVLLEGGVLGRADDMMIIRGVNVFPSSIEQILRSFPEIVEYRMTAHKAGAMDALTVEIEDRLERPERVAKEMQVRLGLKVAVRSVPSGSLPRFEGKGKRFVDRRGEGT
ncbi:MAG: phenylacetate--CoA ligase family protein [Planctomycetes bacterium]|nr:phenylacetate--CoA ligase family protein [Planctomycetota bacterium]